MRPSNLRTNACAYPRTNAYAYAYPYAYPRTNAYAYPYSRTNAYAYPRTNPYPRTSAYFDTESKFIKLNQSVEHIKPKQSVKFTTDCYANTTNKHRWKRCSGQLCAAVNYPNKCRRNTQRKGICTWLWSCVIPRANRQTQYSSAKLVSCAINKSGNTQ